MKKLVSAFLTLCMLSTCFITTVTAAAPPGYSTLMISNIDDLISWIQTEDIETFQQGAYQGGISSLRAKGELLVPSYEDASIEFRFIEVLHDQTTTDGLTGMLYYFYPNDRMAVNTILIKEINPENASLLEEGLSEYFTAQYGDRYSGLPEHETTIGADAQETITYITLDSETSEGDGADGNNPEIKSTSTFFIKDGFEVQIAYKPKDSWDIKYINDLCLDIIPFTFDESNVQGGLGDILMAKNAIEIQFGYDEYPVIVAQTDADTQVRAKESVDALISKHLKSDMTFEVIDGAFTPAIAGTKDNPAGTNGSYTFTVKVSKNNKQKMTKSLTLVITATAYPETEVSSSPVHAAGMPDKSWYTGHENDDTYTINTADQLAGLSELVNSGIDFKGKTITLGSNVDLSDYGENFNDGKGWIPIGRNFSVDYQSNGSIFSGTFDGNGHKITGLYIDDPLTSYASYSSTTALFGVVSGGTIRNLGIADANITGGVLATTGGIVSLLLENSTVEKCCVTGNIGYSKYTGDIEGTPPSGGYAIVGGVVGDVSGGSKLKNCYSEATVNGEWLVGGIAAAIRAEGSVENCYAVGNVSGLRYVGGVVGGVWSSGEIGKGGDIINCAALNSKVKGNSEAGRILGVLNDDDGDSKLSGNYAFSGLVDGNGVTTAWTNKTHDGLDGKDMSMEEAHTAEFWTKADNWDTNGWDTNIWTFENGKLPVLKMNAGEIPESSPSPSTSPEVSPSTVPSVQPSPSAESVKTPVAIPNGGIFTSTQMITLTCETSGATIYYTTDGTAPTTNSTVYISPFMIFDTTTIKAIAVKEDMADSAVMTASFTKYIGTGGGGGGGGTTSYTVKFETNGGSAIADKTVDKGDKITKPASPTKEGYTFAGWYSDKELTQEYDFGKDVTGNITLYAKWIENENVPTPSPSTEPGWQNPFSDINSNDWFYSDVEYVYTNNLFKGITETEFEPNVTMTRGMLVTVLWRMQDSPAAENQNPFGDVPDNVYLSLIHI